MIAHGKDIKVFTGNSNPKLAQNICQELGIPLGDSEVGAFSDGENFASIYETVRGSDVFVVQSTCSFRKDDKSGSVNDALMELLIMIDALRRASAHPGTGSLEYRGNYDGRGWRWYRVSLVSLFDTRGDVYGLLGKAEDISERKAARWCCCVWT